MTGSEGAGTSSDGPVPLRPGLRLLAERRFAAARDALLPEALSAAPDAPWACQLLVVSLLCQARSPNVETYLARALETRPAQLDYALGYLQRRTGRPDLAWDRLAAARDSGGAMGWAARLELGYLLCRRDGAREGRRLLQAARRRYRRRGDAWGEAAAVTHLAALALERMQLRRARALHDEAARLKLACSDRIGWANVMQNLGLIHFYRAEYQTALQLFETASREHERLGYRRGLMTTLINVGVCYNELADPRRAELSLTRALRQARRVDDPMREAAALGNLAISARLIGDLRKAMRRHADVVRLGVASHDADAHGVAVAVYAQTATLAGHPELALAALLPLTRSPTARMNPRTHVFVARELARAWLDRGELKRAAAALRRADRWSHRMLATPERGLATLQLELEAIKGRALLAAGQPATAHDLLRSAAAELESLLHSQRGAGLRMGLIEAHRDIHDTQLRALLTEQAADPRPAWACASRLKARELRETLAGDDGSTGMALPRQRRATRARVALQANRLLSPTTALFEYHVARDTTLVFVAQGSHVAVADLRVGELTLRRLVRRLMEPIVAAARSHHLEPHLERFDLRLAARLARRLIEPAQKLLVEDAERLIIIADGPLHALPFELLVQGEIPADVDPVSPEGIQWLGVRHIVSHALSTELILRDARPRRGAAGELLALGYSPAAPIDVATPLGNAAFGRLPGVRTELQALARLPTSVETHEGATATATTYAARAPHADLLHISAHAVADELTPLNSGLVLAPARIGDAPFFLTADAIRSVPLKARVVTLSACDTGTGQLRLREGVLGLARSFLEAGAEAVLASLTPVTDDAARVLMPEFYRHLIAGKDCAEALALAKRRLREGPPRRLHPFYWAPFVLIDHAP